MRIGYNALIPDCTVDNIQDETIITYGKYTIKVMPSAYVPTYPKDLGVPMDWLSVSA